MKFKELLSRGKEHINNNPGLMNQRFSVSVFVNGAQWMCDRMNELDTTSTRKIDKPTHYGIYGFGKYALCLISSIISFILLFKIHIVLTVFSILVFYLVEIHFLFLFPLVIDDVKNPIIKSIKLTYSVGIGNALITVIPIALFMIIGLFNRKQPLFNWHVGCMSVLIWYVDEVRGRL